MPQAEAWQARRADEPTFAPWRNRVAGLIGGFGRSMDGPDETGPSDLSGSGISSERRR
jgi:hypothetical protein